MKLLIVGLGSMGKRRARLCKGIDAATQIIGVDTADSRRKEAAVLQLADETCATIAEAAALHPDADAIAETMRKALSPEFAAVAATAKSPYNGGDTSAKICAVLRSFDFSAPKSSYDGPVPHFDPERNIDL